MAAKVRHDTVLDPAAEQLGRIYAEALLAAADKSGVADRVVEQLREVVDDLIKPHPQLAIALASPRVEAAEKLKILERLLGDQVDATLMRFFRVVAHRGRLGELAHMATAARQIRDEVLGRVVAEVRSAVPLDDELKQSVIDRLSQVLRKEVVLRERVDPELIGGLVIRIGDTVFDTSVAWRLAQMSKRTHRAFAHEIITHRERFASGSPETAG